MATRNTFKEARLNPITYKYANEEGLEPQTAEELQAAQARGPVGIEIENPSRNLFTEEGQQAVKEWTRGRRPATGGEDWIDVENDPLVRFIKTEQEKETVLSQPTELEKKFGEMGLEYDYTKRKPTNKVEVDTDTIIEQENPAFVQRGRDYKRSMNLLTQLDDQYNFKKGQMEALELSIFANRDYASSSLGRQRMGMIRQEQQQLDALYQAEVAKLDGQFYEALPDRDMDVANMLLGQGLTGKRMSRLTTNNGDIRDSIDTFALQVPEDKREEFKARLLGDYVKDDQGNVVRNALGEELRQGGDYISVTPYGTYDYKISNKAYATGMQQLLQEYGGGTVENDPAKIIDSIDKEIESIEKIQGRLNREDPNYKKLNDDLDGRINFLSAEAANILLTGRQGTTATPTGEATTEATTGEATTTEITAEESQLEEIKKSYLRSPNITELANGLLSYDDDLPEDKKKIIDEFNKKIEEEKIRKSGRSPILEAIGIAPVVRQVGDVVGETGRAIGRTIESGANLAYQKTIGGVADFLSGIEETGRRKILEEETTKSRATQGKGLFD